MRFAHKKIPKCLAFSHTLSNLPAGGMYSISSFVTWSDDKSYLAITTNPQIYGIICMCGGRYRARGQADPTAMLKD
jgi:hypothetical protein